MECSYQQAGLSPKVLVYAISELTALCLVSRVASLLLTVLLSVSMYKVTSVLLSHGFGDFCFTQSLMEKERSYFAVRCCVPG